MSFDVELLDLMPSTVNVAPFSSRDQFAVPSYGADVAYQCRVSLKDELVRSHDGREIVARGKVYVPAQGTMTTSTFTTQDRITLPAGYAPSQPPILDVQPENDDVGLHHVVLVIG